MWIETPTNRNEIVISPALPI